MGTKIDETAQCVSTQGEHFSLHLESVDGKDGHLKESTIKQSIYLLGIFI